MKSFLAFCLGVLLGVVRTKISGRETIMAKIVKAKVKVKKPKAKKAKSY